MAQNVAVCDLEPALKDDIKKFRFRKEKCNAALIMKINREKHLVCLDELIENIDVDELRDALPSHQPRFVLYSYKLEHSDGRVAYPLCCIFLTPQDCQPELQMMYAGTKLSLEKEADVSKVNICYFLPEAKGFRIRGVINSPFLEIIKPLAFEIRELDELTTEWLEEKLHKT